MSYNVPSKGGNASYIVRDTTDYPEKFEPMISEYAQLLTDINNGISLVSGVDTGAEYFAYLSGRETIEVSSNTLIISNANATIYNNKFIVMTGTDPIQLVLAVNTASILGTNYSFKVMLYSTSTAGLEIYGEPTLFNYILAPGNKNRLFDQYTIATVTYLPNIGSGINYSLTIS